MCGVAGIFAFRGGRVCSDELHAMTERLAHRGPDDAGYLFADGTDARHFGASFVPEQYAEGGSIVGLGHRRLAIVDLSPAGHQPMADPSGQVWLTYNGELYNFREIRADLERRGHVFRSHCDSEVIVHAYLADGLDAFATFDGMFALAIWDQRRRRLVLARDRFGVKPLYYTVADGRLVFGSEIKALLAARGVRPAVNHRALAQHFTFQNTLDDSSFFKDVYLLPAGQLLVCDEGGPTRRRFYTWAGEPDAAPPIEEAAHELRERFEAAVERQTMGDVPVGSFMSGGMDTGAISTVAARKLSPLHTFTGGFETDATVSAGERAFDESRTARELSAELGTIHHEITLGPTDLWSVLPKVVWHLDEPRVGISYQVYYVARLVREAGVTVVLSGVGGDELFGGYPWRYRPAAEWTDREAFARNYYASWHRMVPAGQLGELFSDESLRSLGGYSTFDTFRSVLDTIETPDPVQRAMWFDARTFLQGLFVVDDKLSMAHSIEGRVPFLDNALVELALRLPASYSLDGQDSKIVLKRAMRGLVSDAMLTRPKTGFTPPDASWYRTHHMDRIRSVLLGERAVERGYFRPSYIGRLLDEHAAGTANHRFLIWSLLCFEWWNRLFLDGDSLPTSEREAAAVV
jgi:asparagine synthase (glutamine-hydrolysing)